MAISDSGDRTEFSTGAVRDMHKGKGRFDLMPLSVVKNILGDDPVIGSLAYFVSSRDNIYLYKAISAALDAVNEEGYVMFDGRVHTMLLETSIHFEDGAEKYGPYNWQHGIPVESYIDSAVRHYIKWLRGDNDERHDRAFAWNLICCIWETKQNRNIERSDA